MNDTTFTGGMDEPGQSMGDVPGGPAEQPEGPAKRLVLASIGAVAAACDTASDTFDRFVDRGQRVRNEFEDRTDEVRRQNAGARGRVGEYVRDAMDAVLNGLNVPSKGDVDTINVKLNILSRKLDDLQIDRTEVVRGPEPPTHPPVTPGELAT